MGRFCQPAGFGYIIRIKNKVNVKFNAPSVRLDRYPVRRGVCDLHRNVLYRQHDPVRQHVGIRWKKGLPKKSDQPWYLMTNLDLPCRPRQAARRISDLYARRFDVEELFRNTKCGQFGYALGQTRITRPDSASLFFIGQQMPATIGLGMALLTALIQQLQAEVPNWGQGRKLGVLTGRKDRLS